MITSVKVLQIVLCIICIILMAYAFPLTRRRISDEKLDFIRKWVEIIVYAVQQTNWAIPGESRKQIVIQKVTQVLAAHGIKITETELDLLIESAVKGMNIGREISKV